MTPVLMYHAIPAHGSSQVGADPHYSVPLGTFARHVGLISSRGLRASSVAAMLRDGAAGRVGITFDDGHATNHAAAVLLRDVGATADFFVNPSTVGTDGFLTWDQLREMAGWGMSIQSHGMHHRFLDDLAPADAEAELRESKALIEERLGTPVSLFAPAGGRLAPDTDALAARLGYQRICSSRVGWWEGDRAGDVPRLAVLATTSEERLVRWLRQDLVEMMWQRGRYALLRHAKRALGNGAYVRIRQRIVGAPQP